MDYFTSDLHLNHNKEFLYGPRGFANAEDHTAAIIKNINDTVGVDDNLYILGDLMLNNLDAGIEAFNQINCDHIHIVCGNHDTEKRIEAYRHIFKVVSISFGERYKYGKWHFMLNHFPMKTCNYDDCDKTPRQRLYNLCGHVHTNDKFLDIEDGAYHVELDAHNNKPVSIEEIINDLCQYWQGHC